MSNLTINKVWLRSMTLFIVAAASPWMSVSADTTKFEQALAKAYQHLSNVERESGDHRDSQSYADRAVAAKSGNASAPDQVSLRTPFLEERYVAELQKARQRLVSTFEKSGREKAPIAAAKAQSSYDCWLEQASEDLQESHIGACKDAFLLAVADVEKALIPPPAPVAVIDPDSDQDGVNDSNDDCPNTPPNTPVDNVGCPEIPSLDGVHFQLNKALLTAEAKDVLNEVSDIVKRNPHIRVDIVGHTDSSGSDSYNQTLSEKRAQSTLQYLVRTGIGEDRMSASGRGESMPRESNETSAGRKANRRVELTARPIN